VGGIITAVAGEIHQKSSDVGKSGEDLACEYLEREGYLIIGRNEKNKLGEIDIIARDVDDTLVFVEVKAMRCSGVGDSGDSKDSLQPEDNVTRSKMGKVRRACELLLATEHFPVKERAGWRIDVVALTFAMNNVTIRHYKNV